MKPNQERFANCAETFLATTKGWEILDRDYEGFKFVALDKEGETVHFIKTAYRTANAVGFPDENASLQSEKRKAFENAAIKFFSNQGKNLPNGSFCWSNLAVVQLSDSKAVLRLHTNI